MALLPPTDQPADLIQSRPQDHCYLCGSSGNLLYQALVDRLSDASGSWGFRQCLSDTCRLVWLDPIPLTEELVKAYVNYYTHETQNNLLYRMLGRAWRGYAGLRLGYQNQGDLVDRALALPLLMLPPLRNRSIGLELRQLPGTLRGRLLEVGCGAGRLLSVMRDLGWDVTGIDFDAKAVERARKSGLRVHLGTIEEHHFETDSFDVVLMSHVIEHVPDPIGLLKEAGRLTRPGGKVLVITPNVASFGHARFSEHWYHLDPPRHLFLFSPRTLRQITEQAGLTIDRLKTTSRSAGGVWSASTAIRRSGVYRVGSKPENHISDRFGSLLFLIQAGLATVPDPENGDELVLLAQKPVPTSQAR